MEHILYKLNFTTALHIGKDSGGASLEDVQMGVHSDTLFSALCCEAVRCGKIDELVELFTDGTLAISDALPYSEEELFLPRPVIFVEKQRRQGDAGLKKTLKSIEYIPLAFFKEYLEGLGQPEINTDRLHYDFGRLNLTARVAVRDNTPPLPYHIASWRFNPGSGLYIIARAASREAFGVLAALLTALGYSGIGGKQSSGWGKFEVQANPVPDKLDDLLRNDKAKYQMLLGTALPVDNELDEVLSNGWYQIVRRGGFVRSETYAPGQLKKRAIYMLAPGSCLKRRFEGGMYDLSDNGAHPVWRCGRSLFVGVTI